jgi:hypothetical protein
MRSGLLIAVVAMSCVDEPPDDDFHEVIKGGDRNEEGRHDPVVPVQWTCDQFRFAQGDDVCDCGCGAVDPDCLGIDIDDCDTCNLRGSCGQFGPSCPGNINPDDIRRCGSSGEGEGEGEGEGDESMGEGVSERDVIYPLVDAWTCIPELYGDGDVCDCGCGAVDPDCTSADIADCESCDAPGSCGERAARCPGFIEPLDTTTCRPFHNNDMPLAPATSCGDTDLEFHRDEIYVYGTLGSDAFGEQYAIFRADAPAQFVVGFSFFTGAYAFAINGDGRLLYIEGSSDAHAPNHALMFNRDPLVDGEDGCLYPDGPFLNDIVVAECPADMPELGSFLLQYGSVDRFIYQCRSAYFWLDELGSVVSIPQNSSPVAYEPTGTLLLRELTTPTALSVFDPTTQSAALVDLDPIIPYAFRSSASGFFVGTMAFADETGFEDIVTVYAIGPDADVTVALNVSLTLPFAFEQLAIHGSGDAVYIRGRDVNAANVVIMRLEADGTSSIVYDENAAPVKMLHPLFGPMF